MDKLKQYQDAILHFLAQYQKETSGSPDTGVKYRIIADRENNSFQLLSVGWNGKQHIFGPVFHFDILEGKIWIQCNNTEREVVDELMASGVLREDIVLGFLSPHARQFSGFAVA